jgi:small subunit ribosomal protein S17
MSKQLIGTVTSDKADKTIVITVRTRKTHPLYKKQYTINTKFMAHDEKNEAKVGDLVTIVETKPLSARKRFKLARVLEKAGASFAETDATADIPEEAPEPKAEKTVKEEVRKEDRTEETK